MALSTRQRTHKGRHPDCKLDPDTQPHRHRNGASIDVGAVPQTSRSIPPVEWPAGLKDRTRRLLQLAWETAFDPRTSQATKSVAIQRLLNFEMEEMEQFEREEDGGCDCPAAKRERHMKARGIL